MKRLGILLLLMPVCLIFLHCGVPRAVWPQKDMESASVNASTLEKKLLIASRKSDFKDQVVEDILAEFRDKPVYMKITGLNKLETESAGDYSAVVILNTCMAWGLDRNVQAFLKNNPDQDRLIILTTSSNGKWAPKMENRTFDAISAASRIERADSVASDIVQKIQKLLE